MPQVTSLPQVESSPAGGRGIRTVLLAALCSVVVAATVWTGLQGAAIVGHPGFLVAMSLVFASMLALWRLKPSRRELILCAVAGLAARAAMLGFPASDDVNRYVWEGCIQLQGHDPFVLPPDSPELAPLRDTIWEGVNHPHIPTIYWPAAQLLFRGLAAVSPSLMSFKVVFVLFDILTALLLLQLLVRRQRPAYHVLLYWLNPLVLVFAAGEGHLEPVLVAAVMAALLSRECGRSWLMFLFLGLAIMTKATALVLVPFVVDRRTIRHVWALALPALLFLFFPAGARHALDVPRLFLSAFSHNGLVWSAAAATIGRGAAGVAALAATLAGLGAVWLFTPDPVRACRNAFATVLLCATTVHPWYFMLMTPFLALFVSPGWLALQLTALPLTFFFHEQAVAAFWHDRVLLMTIEYGAFIGVAAAGLWWRLRTPPRAPAHVPSVSVLVPALNEAERIGPCIESVRQQGGDIPIVLADGGSTDGTVETAAGFPAVSVVQGTSGRGPQIAAGVDTCITDIIIVLHADSRLAPDCISRIRSRLADNPDIVGGACGARYDHPSVRFRLTELLNNLRVLLFGISFGDQAQFFRREAMADHVPACLLMEDVELSYRMKEQGPTTFVPRGVVSSTRRWHRKGYLANFVKVVLLSGMYVVRRRLGLLSRDCAEFHRWYYGTTV